MSDLMPNNRCAESSRATAEDNPFVARSYQIVVSDRVATALLVTALAAGAVLRAWLSFHDDGIYWPDEIYESLEPAHRLVFGYGLIAWEFLEGARNWTLPGGIAALLKIASWVGFTDSAEYLRVIRLVLSAVGVAAAYGSYLTAVRFGTSRFFAACGASLYALVAPAIYFAPRALGENISTLPIILGLGLSLPKQATRYQRVMGVSLLGFATLLRLQNGLICAAVLAVFVIRWRWAKTAEVAIVFGVWAVILGGLDRLTWGSWFRSPIIYILFNMHGETPITGASPASYYATMLLSSMPLVTVMAAMLCVLSARRAVSLLFVVAVFIAIHVVVDNKAYRYLLPIFPAIGALVAIGLQAWSDKAPRTSILAVTTLLAAAVWSAATFHSLTFGKIGPFEKVEPFTSAYELSGSVNRLLIVAGRRADLCGLRIERRSLTWVGGYSYFHKAVPLYGSDGPARVSLRYNYAITIVGSDAGTPVASDGEWILGRLSGSCLPDHRYDSRLPGWQAPHQKLNSVDGFTPR